MRFIPFYDKIEIKPLKKETVIVNEKESLIEAGEVISIGSSVTFAQPGDTIFFESWGYAKTPDINGEIHYVVTESPNVIIGKISEHE